MLVEVEGIILNTKDYSDTSKIITLFTYEYGVINGYVLPIVTLPSFLSSAISNALLPVISYKYQKNDKNFSKNLVWLQKQRISADFGL